MRCRALTSKLSSLVAGGVGLILLLAPAPAAGDWLVTRDGARVETEGAWEVKGRLVVFSAANGTLSSLQLRDVDLAASGEATAEALRAPKAEERAEPRQTSVVLTDEDVGHLDPSSGAVEADSEAEAAAAPAGPSTPTLEVTAWREEPLPEDDGLQVIGTVRNTGPGIAARIQLIATVYDVEEEFLGVGEGQLSTQALAEGRQATFRVPFPGLFTFSSVTFETKALSIAGEAPEPAPTPPPPSG